MEVKMRGLLLGVVLSFFAATAAQADCTARNTRAWGGFSINALASGPTCNQAVVTIVIRTKSGEPKMARSYIAAQLMNFSQSPSPDAKAMTNALKEWTSGNGFMTSVDKLTLGGEFPFTPDDGLDAPSFKAFRTAKTPIFCYIQGMESGLCIGVRKDGELVQMGVQSFPG
jgi:hypothetical protein